MIYFPRVGLMSLIFNHTSSLCPSGQGGFFEVIMNWKHIKSIQKKRILKDLEFSQPKGEKK